MMSRIYEEKNIYQLVSDFNDKDLILIASRPSVGKTTMAVNITECFSECNEKTVAYFSLEMDNNKLCHYFEDEVIGDNIYIDDTFGLAIEEIEERICKMAANNNLGLIIIDYFQLLSISQKCQSMKAETEIIKKLKSLAKNYKVPIILLSMLSHSVDTQIDGEPHVDNLRLLYKYNFIEYFDTILFLYRMIDDVDKDFVILKESKVPENNVNHKNIIKLRFPRECVH